MSQKNDRLIDTFVAPQCSLDIEYLYQDEHLLLINKPTGLLSLSGKNPLNKDSVHHRLVQKFPTATMVHRLDLGTSGIMVIALNKSVNAHLCKQFQNRTVIKSYVSVLAGHVMTDKGQIDLSIAKDKSNFPRLKICHIQGKPALTEFQVLARSHDLFSNDMKSTKILFRPQTGRTHQLRIHSQAIGHPILGCDLYGTEETKNASDRLLLHAEKLQFEHPVSNELVLGYCPSPF